ncbi:MAG: hypothetical protein ACK4PR_07450, partial [Gammaproteobacteria bacterium]
MPNQLLNVVFRSVDVLISNAIEYYSQGYYKRARREFQKAEKENVHIYNILYLGNDLLPPDTPRTERKDQSDSKDRLRLLHSSSSMSVLDQPDTVKEAKKYFARKHATILNGLGITNDYLGNPKLALSYFQEAFFRENFLIEESDLAHIPTYNNDNYNEEKGKKVSQKLLKGINNGNITFNSIKYLINSHYAYCELGKYDKVISNSAIIEAIIESQYKKFKIGVTITNNGNNEIKSQEELNKLNPDVEERKKFEDSCKVYIDYQNSLGICYSAKSRFHLAYTHYQKALEAYRLFKEYFLKKENRTTMDDLSIICYLSTTIKGLSHLKRHLIGSKLDNKDYTAEIEEIKNTVKKYGNFQHPMTVVYWNALGDHAADNEQLEVAKEYYKDALRIANIVYEGKHPIIARILVNLGTVDLKLAKSAANNTEHPYNIALSYFDRAVIMNNAIYDGNHPSHLSVEYERGRTYLKLGKITDAKQIFKKILSDCDKFFGKEHPHFRVVLCLNYLGLCYIKLRKYKLGEEYLSEAEKKQKELTQELSDLYESMDGDIYLADIYYTQAKTYMEMKVYDKAKDKLQQAKIIYDNFFRNNCDNNIKNSINYYIRIIQLLEAEADIYIDEWNANNSTKLPTSYKNEDDVFFKIDEMLENLRETYIKNLSQNELETNKQSLETRRKKTALTNLIDAKINSRKKLNDNKKNLVNQPDVKAKLLTEMNAHTTHFEYALIIQQIYAKSFSQEDDFTRKCGQFLTESGWANACVSLKGNTIQNDFHAETYVNYQKKQIIIGYCNSSSHEISDDINTIRDYKRNLNAIYDNVSHYKTKAISYYKTAIEKIKESMDEDEFEQYKISFTGHLFGALLAEFVTWHLTVCCLKRDLYDARKLPLPGIKPSAVTFDSPGSDSLIESVSREFSDSCLAQVNVTTYLSLPNVVNTFKKHIGRVYYIPVNEMYCQKQ